MVVAYLLGQFADLESEQGGRRQTGMRMACSAVFQLFYWSLCWLWCEAGVKFLQELMLQHAGASNLPLAVI